MLKDEAVKVFLTMNMYRHGILSQKLCVSRTVVPQMSPQTSWPSHVAPPLVFLMEESSVSKGSLFKLIQGVKDFFSHEATLNLSIRCHFSKLERESLKPISPPPPTSPSLVIYIVTCGRGWYRYFLKLT